MSSRSTPTRVGKSDQSVGWRFDGSVHPHACGEICRTRWIASPRRGPPPRVWGNRSDAGDGARQGRSTPTRVGKSRTHSKSFTPGAVHPHACGEIQNFEQVYRAMDGPPPRVWGNRCDGVAFASEDRSTPTRVGKSIGGSRSPAARAVHPHACGEIVVGVDEDFVTAGPPPRVWGNRSAKQAGEYPRRSTPTRVGKSLFALLVTSEVSVHPHACGEI